MNQYLNYRKKQHVDARCTFPCPHRTIIENLNSLKMQDLLQFKAYKFSINTQNHTSLLTDNRFSPQSNVRPGNTRYKDILCTTPPRRSCTEKAVRYYIHKLINEAPLNMVGKLNAHTSYQGFLKCVKLICIVNTPYAP